MFVINMPKKQDISVILLADGLISAEGLALAQGEAKLSGLPLETVLLNKKLVGPEELAQSLAKQLDIPYIKLSGEKLDPQAVKMIPLESARALKAIPVKSEGSDLYVAFVSPWDLPAMQDLSLATGFKIKPMAASLPEVEEAIKRHYRVEETSKQTLVDMRFDQLKDGSSVSQTLALDEEISGLADLPIVKLLDDIIQGAVNSGASDIHIEPQFPEMAVRYRVDGILHDIMTIPKQAEALIVSRVKVLANMDITESRRPQDGHIRVDKEGREYDIRVSTVLTVNGENVVMRILDKGSLLLGLDRLGLSGRDAQVFSSLITKPYGMILVTGPTGSGKTTTLYAVLNQIDSLSRNVITIEDPVEYRLERITQIQVDAASNMTFASGLRTMLRQDPDIVMVGEIRDAETAQIAVQAALTGHLVLSTLHTNDASSVVTRLIDMGVEPFLIASTLIGALAQRLCRRICPECKEEYEPVAEEQEFLKSQGLDTRALKLARGRGCALCYNTGFKGRSGVFEILQTNDDIRKLIMERRPRADIAAKACAAGMRTLSENGLQKILDKTSTLEEVKRVVYVE